MGKRFGRNQKRRMRAEIAERNADVDNLSQVLAGRDRQIKDLDTEIFRLHDNIRRLEGVIDRARDVLGRYWVGLPPETVKVDRLPDHEDEALKLHIPSRLVLPDFSRAPTFEAFDRQVSWIDMMVMRGQVSIDDLRNEAHVIFSTSAGAVGYGFTRMAFRNCAPEHASKLIATAMAAHLVNHPEFKKLMEHGRR